MMGGRFLAGLGRICLSAIFLFSAAGTIFYWSDNQQELVNLINTWNIHGGSGPEGFMQYFLYYPSLVLLVAVILQLLGGIFLLFGVRVRLGAFLLLCYMVPSLILHHHFWFLSHESMLFSLTLFLKGLAIIGGLLVVWGLGKGVTKKSVKKKEEDFPLDVEHEEHSANH